MTNNDVLIERVRDESGAAVWTAPASPDESREELWQLRRPASKQDATVRRKMNAIDLALKWLADTDGKIYIREKLDEPSTLYEPTA